MSYVTTEEFAAMSSMPASHVEDLNCQAPLYLDNLLAEISSRIDAKLRKRYAVPFKAPVPAIVKGWVVRIATPRAYIRIGVNPSDEQFQLLQSDAEEAWKEVGEAADATDGLFDLPLRADTSQSGISTAATLAYSEASPYTAFDVQRRRVRVERF